jgi:hypothetical protein
MRSTRAHDEAADADSTPPAFEAALKKGGPRASAIFPATSPPGVRRLFLGIKREETYAGHWERWRVLVDVAVRAFAASPENSSVVTIIAPARNG